MVGFLDPFLFVLGGVVVVVCLFVLVFRDRVSLYSPGCPGTHSVDQAGLELRNPSASASLKESAAINQILGRKVMPAAVNSSWQRGLRVSAYPDGSVCLHPLSLSGTTQERSGEGLPSLF